MSRIRLIHWNADEAKERAKRLRRFGYTVVSRDLSPTERQDLRRKPPEKAFSVKTDVSERLVRQTGLDAGLVDYKICAIDEIWSGLKFSVRKAK